MGILGWVFVPYSNGTKATESSSSQSVAYLYGQQILCVYEVYVCVCVPVCADACVSVCIWLNQGSTLSVFLYCSAF